MLMQAIDLGDITIPDILSQRQIIVLKKWAKRKNTRIKFGRYLFHPNKGFELLIKK